MKVFVDTLFGSKFSFNFDPRNKVFDVKKSIEISQGIPFSMQTLYFNGVELVVDHYQLRMYRIVHKSRLLLLLRADHFTNQMLHQSPYAIHGFVPSVGRSNYNQVTPPHASASLYNQYPLTMARSNQVPPLSHASASFFNQNPRMMPRSNQVLHQTQISPVPPPPPHANASFNNQYPRTMVRSNQVLPPSHASASFLNQDQLAMPRSNQVPPLSHASEAFFNQDLRTMPRSNQVLHQTQISPVPPLSHASASFYNQDPRNMARSNQVLPPSHASACFLNQNPRTMARSYQAQPPSHASASFLNQDRLVSNDGLFPEMPQDISLNQGFWPGTTFGDNNKIQESNQMNQDLLQKEPYLPSNTHGAIANENQMFPTDRSSAFGDFSFGDYSDILTDSNWPATASTFDEIINDNHLFQTEHSVVQSNSTQESSSQVLQTDKSPPPQKLKVTMTQYDKPGRTFQLEVNASDNVEELKNYLEFLLDLPAEGYFLLHKERVLDDDKSFCINRVADGDTIEIFPGPDIEDHHT